jgi:excisionase family DNA binding protein
MERYLYEVELTPDEDGAYTVTVPDIPGCISGGLTIEEALVMAADALMTYVASLIKHGDEIPRPTFGNAPQEGGMVVAVSFETDASYIIDAVSPTEAAAALNVSRGRISQMIRAGQLDAHKMGSTVLVDRASINARLASPRKTGRPRKELTTA